VEACNHARERGYHFQLAFYQYYEAGSVEAALSDLLRNSLDGILSIATHTGDDPDIASILDRSGLSFAMAYYGSTSRANADCVVVDQRQGAYLATERLIRQGRKRIAYAGGAEFTPVVATRTSGWREALRDFGLAQSEPLITGIFAEGGCAAVRELGLRGGEMPDAIVAFDDEVASGILRGLRSMGLSVPQDVAVIGFNDYEAVCNACDPALTSVRMPMTEVGRLSAKLLIDRLEAQQEWVPESVALPCSLTVRASG
jgi:LacI family transcriptional regulator